MNIINKEGSSHSQCRTNRKKKIIRL